MLGNLDFSRVRALVAQYWRVVVGACLAGAAVYVAIEMSDRQGRFDISYGYSVAMTCEEDPESYIWGGGCDRIKADIARKDRPSFLDLYRAFVTVHHTRIPSPATSERFADIPCESDFDLNATLKGTRFILSADRFENVCSRANAEAIMEEIDERDRALLTIERGGLSFSALAAGAIANLTEPLILFAAAAVILFLWFA